MFKKIKVSDNDLEKVNVQIQEQKKCLFCTNQKAEIKKCAESHKVKNNLKSITFHILKCSDCRNRIKFMADCKKNKHRE